jgi:hypothetical protein
VPIGDVSNGLCGGTAFAVRDYFERGGRHPDAAEPPAAGPLFGYLVDRLFDGFDLPVGPTRHLEFMNPLPQDGESIWSRFGLGPRGPAWWMAREEWPKVRAGIDLRLYDPNLLGSDDVTLSLDLSSLDDVRPPPISPAASPVFAFFRAPCEPATRT